MSSSERAFFHDKYWLKRARVPADRVEGAEPGLAAAGDGTVAADVRIENGCIRAVVPAGGAPCCCRGIDLEGGCVRPLAEDGRIAPGRPADLWVEHARGGCVVLRGGKPEGPCALGIDCVCTPPATR